MFFKHVEKSPCVPLENGDLVISLSSIAPTTPAPDFKKLAEKASHGTIFYDNDIVHATPSVSSGSRVGKKSIFDEFEKIENFGSIIVLRCKDPKVQNYIGAFSNLALEAKEFTPFSYYDRRREDFPDEKSSPELELKRGKLEFYRAFRAFVRIETLQPISKKKGVSCGNFLSYVVKAAIIKKVFPEKFSEEIKIAMAEIEKNRLTEANKKLDKVPEKLINDFFELAKKAFDSALLKELCRPVKKRSLKELVASAENFWQVGYLFYERGMRPAMMSHEMYRSYITADKGLNLYRV